MGFDKATKLLGAYYAGTSVDPAKWDGGGAWFADSVASMDELLDDHFNTSTDNDAALAARATGDTGAIAAARTRLHWLASMRRDIRRQYFGSNKRLYRPFDALRRACLRNSYAGLVLQRLGHIVTRLAKGAR